MRTRYAGRSKEELDEMFSNLATFRDTVLDNARVEPGDNVLDVGAGTGLLALAAAERVGPEGDVVAVDVSADALEELRRVATSPNISYFIGNAEVLPVPDGSVDVVLTRSVLIYVDEKAEAVREFFRVLRAGGRVSIFEPINSRNTRLSEAIDFGALADQMRKWEDARYGRADDPMLNFDERDLGRFFVEAGFAEVNVDFRSWEQEIAAERLLTGIGAPGRSSLRADWGCEFGAEDVKQLVAAVHAQSPVRLNWPQVYLTASKP